MKKNKFLFEDDGKVIRILSQQRILINIGDESLTIGDKVLIFSHGDKIKDLDGKDLGNYEINKDILTVIETAKAYSTCAKIVKKVTTPLSEMLNTTVNTWNTSKEITVENPLNVEESDINPLEIQSDSKIRVGDYVRII